MLFGDKINHRENIERDGFNELVRFLSVSS